MQSLFYAPVDKSYCLKNVSCAALHDEQSTSFGSTCLPFIVTFLIMRPLRTLKAELSILLVSVEGWGVFGAKRTCLHLYYDYLLSSWKVKRHGVDRVL